jgi:hypothetical protein
MLWKVGALFFRKYIELTSGHEVSYPSAKQPLSLGATQNKGSVMRGWEELKFWHGLIAALKHGNAGAGYNGFTV